MLVPKALWLPLGIAFEEWLYGFAESAPIQHRRLRPALLHALAFRS